MLLFNQGIVLLVILLTLSVNDGQGQEFESDTVQIKILLDKGDQFIDGPSDSLIHYYSQALKLINTGLNQSDVEGLTFYKYKGFKVNIGLGIEHFYSNNYETALRFYHDALHLASDLNDPNLLSECNSEIGILYKHQGKYNEAVAYYVKALRQAELTRDTSWLAACQINLGNVYKELGYLIIAQKNYIQALNTLEKLDKKRWVSACYQNIGDIYSIQKDYQSALFYFNKSLELALETGDKVREIACYLQLGTVNNKLHKYEQALSYLVKTFELYETTGYQHEQDECFVLLGDSYIGLGNLKLAIDYYEKALEISRSKDDMPCICETKGRIGSALLMQKNYHKAYDYFLQSYHLACELNAIDLQIEANSNMSLIHEKLGQDRKALKYYKEYTLLKDSLYSSEKYKAIKDVEKKYESEKKEQKLVFLTKKHELQELKLNRRNRLFLGSIAGILLLAMIAYLLYNQRRLKMKNKAIDLEQKLLRSQMNPHFIFNSLIAIQSYIYKKEPLLAGDYLAKFADLVRNILENSRLEFVALEKEYKTLKAYLELQSLRFEGEFEYELIVETGIDAELVHIPPMFAQPFIENAIEHGLRYKKEKGKLSVTYRTKNDCCMEITVEDDGIGREKAKQLGKKKDHQSLALSISKERLNALSSKFNQLFTLEVIDLFDEQNIARGTKVIISLPSKML